jgi:cysteine desulfurase/selenocysteine lyase
MGPRLYLDNAATSFPKPPEVLEAMRRYAESLGASAGRGAYHEALQAGEQLAEARRRLARLIGAKRPETIVFGHNCTWALNQAIKGWLRPGDHVVTTRMEHNSTLRPLAAMESRGLIHVTRVAADPATGIVHADEVMKAVRPDTKLVTVLHASNVTGAIQPIEEIAARLAATGAALLVDAAQTAGHVPIDVTALGIDLLAMPGHKGLLGPLGTGALYIRPGLEERIQPLAEGGTGSVSERPIQPDFMPDKYESGSHNSIGLAGLSAAMEWIEAQGVERLRAHETALCERFIQRCRDLPGLHLYGPRDPGRRVGVFSIRIEGLDPQELSALLEAEFGILTRSGMHCAPLTHETLGTLESGGTTRLSFGPFSEPADVDRVADAIEQLCASPSPGR